MSKNEKILITYVRYSADGSYEGKSQKWVNAEEYYEQNPVARSHKFAQSENK